MFLRPTELKLAEFYTSEGRLADADRMLRRVFDEQKQFLGPRGQGVGATLSVMSYLKLKEQRCVAE